MKRIKVALVGVGNCASALVQGIHFYQSPIAQLDGGIPHPILGGYSPADIEISVAFDVDTRKVGTDLSEAIFAAPNCTKVFWRQIPQTGTIVQMGPVLDGVAPHMTSHPEDRRFLISSFVQPNMDDVVRTLTRSEVDIVVNYLPVGSSSAVHFYAESALRAGCAFVNCVPEFIATDPNWSKRFMSAGLPVLGDDIKSQIGATALHRALLDLFEKRGARIRRTYQLNTGGNTDFLNMLDRNRLESKKKSKTEAVLSATQSNIEEKNIHVGPSDYVSWQNDNKICFIRIEAIGFGSIPIELDLRLSVEDSSNSAAIVIDAIRCAKIALEREQAGAIITPSSYLFKRPPVQFDESESHSRFRAYFEDPGTEPRYRTLTD
jgi:myo-inositol-1-phosphate synthase